MPHTLALTYRPSVRVLAERVPAWKKVLRAADEGTPALLTLWLGLFQDARQATEQAPLETALDVHVLEGGNYLAQVWEQTVEEPARRLLPALGASILLAGMTAVLPTLSRLAQTPLAPVEGLVSTQQWLAQYVGQEIRDITVTSRQTIQQTLREGLLAHESPATLARRLRHVLGVTPRQRQQLATLRLKLEAQGLPARQVLAQVARATRQALQQRAQTIAAHEAMTFANAGAQRALETAVQSGRLAGERVRRFWTITPGACPDCVATPGLNPEGVRVDESFQTPFGPHLFPPAHVRCRCVVAVRLQGI